MECRDAQFYLRWQRHATDELGAEVTTALRQHLAQCPVCAAESQALLAFDKAIARAMKAVPVPPALRDRIRTHVATQRGARLRVQLYRTAVSVAAAVVLVLLGLSIFSSTRPRVDPQMLAELADDQLHRPDDYIQNWLIAQKLPTELPHQFDWELVTHRGFDDVQGLKVPVIVFTTPDGRDFAKVYIFRKDGRFDMRDLHAGQASRASADVYDTPHAVYVIVYTGGPRGLQRFLTNRPPGGPAT
ncbi:MAG: DUF3379 family protein [Gemmataceae bacterium]|nr:DUF3379 domain-containing protein [Gemmata sp.]MDW8196762.1 DUF3379 family protein [Gemmataceae bacterium]